MMEWTDEDGMRAVLNRGHLSVYGKPSMTRDDGVVAVGVDLPLDPNVVTALLNEIADELPTAR